jgi:hypothetical protein
LIRYLNAKHPAICWPLLPWFVEDDKTVQEIFLELYGRLEKQPEDTYVDIAMDGDKCMAILIAYINDGEVWIWQARVSKNFKKQKQMFNRLKKWSSEKDVKYIRMKTSGERLEKFYKRRYRFHKNGDIMELAI